MKREYEGRRADAPRGVKGGILATRVVAMSMRQYTWGDGKGVSGNGQPLAGKGNGVRGCRAGGPRLGLEWNAFSCSAGPFGERAEKSDAPERGGRAVGTDRLTAWQAMGALALFAQSRGSSGQMPVRRLRRNKCKPLSGRQRASLPYIARSEAAILQEQPKRGRDSTTGVRISRPPAPNPCTIQRLSRPE